MNEVTAPVADPVLFEEHVAGNGKRIGMATLNAPKTLNGLSLQMSRLLDQKLVQWAQDDQIAMVVLQGAGEKAFCAGGDLHGLYRGMREHAQQADAVDPSGDPRASRHAAAFFEVEYRLDYRIHSYAKPLLCWGHGIVMGGGIGLMAGASHRVVSDRSKLAFPEITIGLYPDVGGSWLLPRVPNRGGLFLALTGVPIGAGDAIYAGLADCFVQESKRQQVFDALQLVQWSDDGQNNRRLLTDLLDGYAAPIASGPLQQHAALIAATTDHEDLESIVAAISSLDSQDPWLDNAKATLAAGAPGSVRLGYELQRRAASLSLADTFRLEYIATLHCAAHGDFAEGIRALLVDKDRNPRWNPATLAQATPAWAETFFTAPWAADAHPLADLGRSTEVA